MESNYGAERIAESRFRFFINLLKIGGVSIFNPSVSRLYRVYCILCHIAEYATLVAVMLEICFRTEDLDHSMDVAMVLMLFLGITYVQFYFRFQSNAVVRMLRLTDAFVWEDLPIREPDTGSLAMVAWIPRIQKGISLVMYSAMTTHIIQSILRILIGGDRSLLYSAWYPFDTTKTPAYELISIIQALATLPWTCCYYALPYINCTMIVIACSQLEKLRMNLLNIRQKQKSLSEAEKDEKQEYIYISDMQAQLKACIRHHHQILQFTDAMEETFCPALAGYFLSLMGVLFFTAYCLVTRWDNLVLVVRPMLTYVTLLVAVCIFCLLGSKLSEQGDRVRDAAFSCDWVGTPVEFQRCIVLIIAMANKVFVLTAGKFVPVSKATLMNIMQESISLFMFMLQIKAHRAGVEETISK